MLHIHLHIPLPVIIFLFWLIVPLISYLSIRTSKNVEKEDEREEKIKKISFPHGPNGEIVDLRIDLPAKRIYINEIVSDIPLEKEEDRMGYRLVTKVGYDKLQEEICQQKNTDNFRVNRD